MTRRATGPLFRSTEPDNYLIDTSALSNIDTREDSEKVWALIVKLIEQGRITICAQVLGEVRDNPYYKSRIKPYEQAIQAGDRNSNDVEYLSYVGQITYDHPAMSKARSEKNPADPYVVALAALEGYVVVADETRNKRPSRKIPGVCDKLVPPVRCLTLDEFVAAERELYEGTN